MYYACVGNGSRKEVIDCHYYTSGKSHLGLQFWLTTVIVECITVIKQGCTVYRYNLKTCLCVYMYSVYTHLNQESTKSRNIVDLHFCTIIAVTFDEEAVYLH